ncbi:transcriptional regulator [Mycolicibacterium peregrinum]|nr:hypothetical protein [Mycolicibacterium peregrinum]OBF42443.1 transcriptional regulator [Mycolicibacterium peregrinum]
MPSDLKTSLDVREVTSPADARRFVDLPWHLYRGDARWRPMLRRVMRTKMNATKNALHREVELANFVAYQGEKPVGRISASIDSEYVKRYGDCGFFGHFESTADDDVAGALLETAENWVRRRGMDKMIGPYSYSTREEVGLLAEGYDTPPTLMQPYNPQHYLGLVESAGYQKKFDSACYRWDTGAGSAVQHRLVRRADAVMDAQGATVRSVRMGDFDNELETLRVLYNDSFARHPENVPLSKAVFAGMASEMRPLIDPRLVRIVEAAGTPVGFLLMLPDVIEIAGQSGRLTPSMLLRIAAKRGGRIRGVDTAVVVLIGAAETQFGAGIGRILAGEIVRASTSGGYSSVATTWVHEDNVWSNSLAAQMKTEPDKRHRVYQKAL